LGTTGLIWFTLLSLLAEVLGTVGGFGSSLFFVPIASNFIDFHSVLGVTAIFHVCSNLTKISLFRHGFNKKIIIRVGLPAVLFVTVGAYVSRFLNSDYLELALSIFLITVSTLLLLLRDKSMHPSLFNAFVGGALSGFMAGLLGSGGVIRGLTLSAFNVQKNVFIATSAVIDLAVDLSRGAVYVTNGYVHKHDLYLIAILVVVSIVGTLIGKKILDYFSEARFKYFVLALILFIGCASLIKLVIVNVWW